MYPYLSQLYQIYIPLNMLNFLKVFDKVAIPDYLKNTFFIEGGALAVENALKVAFDWKHRKI